MIVTTQAEADIRASPERVCDISNDLDGIGDAFVGYGPIPGVVRAEVIGGSELVQGSSRRVYTADGNDVVEEMLILERGRSVAYTLTGISPPFSFLVKYARADWTFTKTDLGTHVHWTYAFTLTSPLAWPLAAPLLHLVFRRWMQGCLTAIAAIAQRD